MITSPRLRVMPLRRCSRLSSPADLAAVTAMGKNCRLARKASGATSSLGRKPAYTSVTLIGQQAKRWPSFRSSNNRAGRPRLLLSASMMTLVSSRKVAMSTVGYSFQAPIVFPAQLLNPLSGSLLQLRVVLVLPRAPGGLQGLDLAQAHQLLFSGPGKEAAAAALADQRVNLGYQLLGDHNMGTSHRHEIIDQEGPLPAHINVNSSWDFAHHNSE